MKMLIGPLDQNWSHFFLQKFVNNLWLGFTQFINPKKTVMDDDMSGNYKDFMQITEVNNTVHSTFW